MAKEIRFPEAQCGNMNNLMKRAQRMQRQMEEGQKELETREFSLHPQAAELWESDHQR